MGSVSLGREESEPGSPKAEVASVYFAFMAVSGCGEKGFEKGIFVNRSSFSSFGKTEGLFLQLGNALLVRDTLSLVSCIKPSGGRSSTGS